MAAEGKKLVTLTSFDGEVFEVEETVAMKSKTIKHMIEQDRDASNFPLSNVTGTILSMAMEYCKKHMEAAAKAGSGGGSTEEEMEAKKAAAEELKAWDAKYIDIDLWVLYDLILAANDLKIKGLHSLACQSITNMIKGKTLDEIHNIFKIEIDSTSEDEEEIRMENKLLDEYDWNDEDAEDDEDDEDEDEDDDDE